MPQPAVDTDSTHGSDPRWCLSRVYVYTDRMHGPTSYGTISCEATSYPPTGQALIRWTSMGQCPVPLGNDPLEDKIPGSNLWNARLCCRLIAH